MTYRRRYRPWPGARPRRRPAGPGRRYHAWLASDAWARTRARFQARPRGQRCAACGTRSNLAQPHHWTYFAYRWGMTWPLVRLCRQHHTGHRGVHQFALTWFGHRTAHPWLATGLVVGAGKLRRLGRRAPDRVISH